MKGRTLEVQHSRHGITCCAEWMGHILPERLPLCAQQAADNADCVMNSSRVTHCASRSNPGIDCSFVAVAKAAVLWLADVCGKLWDLLKQRVLRQVYDFTTCTTLTYIRQQTGSRHT